MLINDINNIIYDMKLSFLILDEVFDTGLTSMLDTLTLANELTQEKEGKTPFDIQLIGVGKQVRSSLGFSITVIPVKMMTRPDWVIVPAINAKQPELLAQALERSDIRQAKKQLNIWHKDGIKIAAACTGTFVLADSGILNGCEATTTWSLAPFFRQRYPQIKLDDSRLIKTSDNIVTAAAMMGHMDLALWFVRQVSLELATLVARFMLIDSRSSQTEYIIPDYLAHYDPLIEKFERWCRDNLSQGFNLTRAADALHIHPRTLQRKTEIVLGKSPLAFFQDLRIERVRQLVLEGCHLEMIANEVGYADSTTLRNLLQRKLGHTLREFRTNMFT